MRLSNATSRALAVLPCLIAALAVSSCTAPRSQAASIQDQRGSRFCLELSPGPEYTTTMGWFIFKVPIYPQVAAWLESVDGRYLGTIYVTGKGARNGWISAPSTGRPEALPVWNRLKQGELDSVSAATSAGETLYVSDLAAELPAGDYIVKLETNRSYDYNSVYTTESSGVCGQPSIVYRAFLTVGKGPAEASFEPIGTGSLDGSDGAIHAGLEGIDTALSLFSRMVAAYRD